MNISYLYSIINLYLKKEIDNKNNNLNINKINDNVECNFSMKLSSDKTNFLVPLKYEIININEIIVIILVITMYYLILEEHYLLMVLLSKR